MNIDFTTFAWENFTFWLETNKKTVIKINELIKSIIQNPFRGLSIPEPFKFSLKGFWSKRISTEHRLVYKITGKNGIDQKSIIIQYRFHYENS